MDEKELLELEKAKLRLAYTKELHTLEERIIRLDKTREKCPELGVEDRVFSILTDQKITGKMLLTLGNYDASTADYIKKYFNFDRVAPSSKVVAKIQLARIRIYKFVTFWYEIQERLDSAPYNEKYIRLATGYELLCFGATYPEIHRKLNLPVVALGNEREKAAQFLYLDTSNEGCRLIKLWWGTPIFDTDEWLFAAICT